MHEATYTPDWLARDIVALADIHRGMWVLEPSAGRGALIEAVLNHCDVFVRAYELNQDNVRHLVDRFSHSPVGITRDDFLFGAEPNVKLFHRVVMNPPVKNSQAHVEHAMKFLMPRGRLVALLHSHVARDIKNKHGAREYRIAGGTFHIDSREVDASLIVWDKHD